MTRQQLMTLEAIFFIVSFGLVLQDPVTLLRAVGDYVNVVSPAITLIIVISVIMVFNNVIKILRGEGLFLNLFSGIVYFVNITKWINII